MSCYILFFFNDTATTEIYTLSLHDALPILRMTRRGTVHAILQVYMPDQRPELLPRCFRQFSANTPGDRKSTRLNSSHSQISYAVFCLKKKKTQRIQRHLPSCSYGSPYYNSQ